MLPENLLILHHDDFYDKAKAFIYDLKKDEALRKLFVENPTEVIAGRIIQPDTPDKLTYQRVSVSNQFLYTVLANKEFYKWMKDYQIKVDERYKKEPDFDKTDVYLDFVDAFAKYGNNDFLPETIRFLADPNNPIKVQRGPSYKVSVQIYVCALIFIFLIIIDISVSRPDNDSDIKLTPAEIRIISELMTDYASRINPPTI